jgi:hypothetical protein
MGIKEVRNEILSLFEMYSALLIEAEEEGDLCS